MAKMSNLERAFMTRWVQLKDSQLPDPEHDKAFHPTRRWRADFIWKNEQVIVECEGMPRGRNGKSRHTQREGYQADAEKYNAAAELGYVVLRYTGGMIHNDPQSVIDQVCRMVRKRLPECA